MQLPTSRDPANPSPQSDEIKDDSNSTWHWIFKYKITQWKNFCSKKYSHVFLEKEERDIKGKNSYQTLMSHPLEISIRKSFKLGKNIGKCVMYTYWVRTGF